MEKEEDDGIEQIKEKREMEKKRERVKADTYREKRY